MAKKVTPGVPERGLDAASWNQFVEATDAYKASLKGRDQRPEGLSGTTRLTAQVFNGTGADITTEFPVLKLDTPTYNTDDRASVIWDGITFNGTTPGATTKIGDIAIVQGPINDEEFRAAVFAGPTWATVNVTDAAHTHAKPIDGDNTKLASSTGGAKILWKPTGTGDKKCQIMLGIGSGSTNNLTSRAIVTDASGASSYGALGITPGTVGKCVLLNEDGAAVDASGVPFSSIGDAVAADKIEFKSNHPIVIPAATIIELSSNSAIQAGTTWDGAGDTTEAKVWAKFMDIYQYVKSLPGAADGTGLGFDGGTAIANFQLRQVLEDVQVDAANNQLEKKIFGGSFTDYHTGNEC